MFANEMAYMSVVVIVAIAVLIFMLLGCICLIRKSRAREQRKDEFVSRLSHEIRTPLGGLIGLNHLMQNNVDRPDLMRDYLAKSDAAAKYLLSIVNDVLDFSKVKQGHMEPVQQPFSLCEMTENVTFMMQACMDEKNIEFSTDVQLKNPNILGDAIRIEQVLINILNNAVKFTPEGGRVTLEVRQEETEDGHLNTKFRICDTGRGMSEQFTEEIFDAFSKEERSASDRRYGTGLGMSISYLLMREMGGELHVSSKLGKGSCFTAILPTEVCAVQTTASPAEPEAPCEDGYDNGMIQNEMRLLVAEDNELNADVLLDILQQAGFVVTMAENGIEAVRIFEESPCFTFDVILMDLRMPIMDGYEAARYIRAADRADAASVKMYAFTANQPDEEREKVKSCGMDGLIAKPIDVGELLKILHEEK